MMDHMPCRQQLPLALLRRLFMEPLEPGRREAVVRAPLSSKRCAGVSAACTSLTCLLVGVSVMRLPMAAACSAGRDCTTPQSPPLNTWVCTYACLFTRCRCTMLNRCSSSSVSAACLRRGARASSSVACACTDMPLGQPPVP